MSDDYQRIELITGAVRRRHWTTEQKLQIIEESFQPGETVSSVARRRGQECLTLEHAKKLAVQTAEAWARDKEYSHLRGKYVQVTDERGNLVYKVSLPEGMPISRKFNGVRLDRT